MFDKIKKLLGLADTASEEDVVAASGAYALLANAVKTVLGIEPKGTEQEMVTAIKAKVTAPEIVACKEVLEALGAGEDEDAEKVVARIKDLRGAQGKKDDIETRFMALKKDHDSLQRRWDERDRDDRVNAAINAGKIASAQKEWAMEYALKDPTGFDAFIAKQPVVVPLERLNLKEGEEGGTPSEQMDRLIAKKMKDDKELTYGEAMNIVSKENPELAKQYIEAGRGKA